MSDGALIKLYSTFSPKSVDNRETFDLNDANIYHQGQISSINGNIVLEINSQEEMKNRSETEFKNDMLDVLKGFKGRKIFNKSLNADIEIRTSSIRKYKSFFADGNKRLIVPCIPELFEKANFSKAEKSYIQQEERNVVGCWKSDLPINIDKQSFIVHLTVKKDNNGNYFWDAQIKGLQTDSATNPRVEDLTSLTISQSEADVKYEQAVYEGAPVIGKINTSTFKNEKFEFDKGFDKKKDFKALPLSLCY